MKPRTYIWLAATFIVITFGVLHFWPSKSSKPATDWAALALVPATAAEVVASPDYKLEHITKSGIQCYVRPITMEIVKSIKAEDHSSGDGFLHGENTSAPYFLVLIRNGKIIDGEAAAAGAVTAAEGSEVLGFVINEIRRVRRC